MTSSTSSLAGARARLTRLGMGRVVAVATSLVVVAGVLAVALGHERVALLAVLLVEGALVALVLEQRRALVASEESVRRQVAESSARTLADLGRVRHAVLTALDERADADPR